MLLFLATQGLFNLPPFLPNPVLAPSLLTLPPEVLLQILSYLSPHDLLRLAPLHSTLHRLTQDVTLWQHLHPVRWAAGNNQFFKPPLIDNLVCCFCFLLFVLTQVTISPPIYIIICLYCVHAFVCLSMSIMNNS